MRNQTFSLTTVGCAKNEVDSDTMAERLRQAGYEEVQNPAQASVILVNTCGFLASATMESLEAVLSAAHIAEELQQKPKVIMCGCVPSRYGHDLISELPEVDAFVPANEEEEIVRVVEELIGPARLTVLDPVPLTPIYRSSPSSFAYLKISEGCDRHCAFCAIPAIRGPQVSKPADEICREARYLVEQGAKELVLVGQDTSAWGNDLAGNPHLAQLLWQMNSQLSDLQPWIRLLYVQPEGLSDELIDAIAETDLVLPYLDLPLQHVSPHILRSMGRKGSAEAFSTLIAKLRARIPSVTIRTTVMSGYPGETSQDHRALTDFLTREAFDYVAVFPFSAEEGTRAFGLAHQVEEAVKAERTQELMDLAEKLGFRSCAKRVGTRAEVLIDSEDMQDPDGPFVGHATFQAPDSDGVVHLRDPELCIGERYQVLLSDAWCYDLEGSVIHEP